MRRARVLIGWWISLLFLWVMLTEKLEAAEIIVGGVASLLAVFAIHLIIERSQAYFQLRLKWLLDLLDLPTGVIRDLWLLTVALYRRLVLREDVRGWYRVVPLDTLGDDPETAARRAVEIFKRSATPNTIVIDFDPEASVLLVHQLVPSAANRRAR